MLDKKDDVSKCGNGCEGCEETGLDIIYLTLEDDTKLKCNVLGTFEVKNKEYIALLPIGEEEVIIYEFIILENGEFEMLPVEEDFETVTQTFYDLISDEQ